MIYIIVAGLLFCHWDENRIVPPEVQLMDDSPFQHPGIDFLGEAKECDPPIVGAHLTLNCLCDLTPGDGRVVPFVQWD